MSCAVDHVAAGIADLGMSSRAAWTGHARPCGCHIGWRPSTLHPGHAYISVRHADAHHCTITLIADPLTNERTTKPL